MSAALDPGRGVAALLAAGVLLCTLLLLPGRRAASMLGTFCAGSLLLAAAAGWSGWHGGGAAALAAAAAALAKAVLAPLALRRLEALLALRPTEPPLPGALALGVAVVALAALLVLPLTAAGAAPARPGLVAGLAVTLLGGLLLLGRRGAVGVSTGLLSLDNGAALVLLAVPGAAPAWLPLASLALVSAMALGFVALRLDGLGPILRALRGDPGAEGEDPGTDGDAWVVPDRHDPGINDPGPGATGPRIVGGPAA